MEHGSAVRRQLKTGGFNDCRMPTIGELGELFNHLLYSPESGVSYVPLVLAWNSTVNNFGKPQSFDLFPGHPPPTYIADVAPKRAVCVRRSGK